MKEGTREVKSMRKKYIIELDEDPHSIRLMQLKNGGDGVPITEFKTVCPYKEPDLEQIIDDAYTKGHDVGYKEGMQLSIDDAKLKEEYKRGLANAWEAAKKIMLEKEDGGFTFNELNDIFGSYSMTVIFRTNTAAEAIAKIKAGEKKKQAQEIKIGDEVVCSDGKKGYIIEIDGHVYKIANTDWKTGTWSKFGFTLTGKNIPEIAIALQKIKGE